MAPRPDPAPTRPTGDIAVATGLALVVTAFAYLFARDGYDNYDGNIMGQVASGLLHRHSVTVLYDGFGLNVPHSFFGIAMSLLMLPTMALAQLAGGTDAAGAMAANAWLLGALAAIVYAWCRVRHLRRGPATVVALAIVVAAGLLPFAATGFSEVALAAAIATGLVAVTATAQGRRWGPLLAGAATGLAVLVRDDSALLVAPWLVVPCAVVAVDRGAALRRIATGGAPFAALWLAYNTARFGAPWRIGHSGVLVFNHPVLDGLYGLTLSPGRGLVLYAPILLVAAAGVPQAWRRSRAVTVAAAGLLLGRILFYAPYWGWYGGGTFGPRYVLPATVVATVGLVEVAEAWPRLAAPWRLAAALVAAAGCAVGVIGAAVDYQHGSLLEAVRRDPELHIDQSTPHAYLDTLESRGTAVVMDRHLFDWGTFPIADGAVDVVHGDNVAGVALTGRTDVPRLATAAALAGAGAGLLVRRRRGRRPSSEG